jgi:PIN domain nuclease of toxin-antitoxin system
MIPDVSAVSDTNALLWYLFTPGRLTPLAKSTLTAAVQADELYIATMTLVDLEYAKDKPGYPYPNAIAIVRAMLDEPGEHLNALELTIEVAATVSQVPRTEIPDMPDRVIAATAVAHGMKLVSSDRKIRNSPSLNALIQVIW